MRSCIAVLLAALISGNFAKADAQDAVIRSGFAIITPVSGNIGGVIASETLVNTTAAGLTQAIVAPSVVVTSASMLVTIGPAAVNTTAIAITNPTTGTGSVNLSLTNSQGSLLVNTVVFLGARGHFAKYLHELFVTSEGALTPGLLTISASIPVAILALNFRDQSFAAVPFTSLASPMPVPLQPLTLPPLISSQPGFGLGIAPSPRSAIVFGSPPATTTSIGGAGSLIFPQVVRGGGWITELAVGNTSAGLQVVRIDFFGSNGETLGGLTDITIPPQGVFFVSTESVGQALF